MIICHTERLVIRLLDIKDSDFIFDLYNQPSFKQLIGDKGINTLEDAKHLIENYNHSFLQSGYAMLAVEHKQDQSLLGINGLLLREQFEYPDIGFAFLPQFWGMGFATESSQAIIALAKAREHKKLLAFTSTFNKPSQRLLSQLGFLYQDIIYVLSSNKNVCLFEKDLSSL